MGVVDDNIAAIDSLVAATNYARAATDIATISDFTSVAFATLNVAIADSVTTTDATSAVFDTAIQPGDLLSTTDFIEVVLTLGAAADDAVNVTDQAVAELLNVPPDMVATTDLLVRSVEYHRATSDTMIALDLLIEGEPVVYGETIDGGVVIGSVDAHTTYPFGPASASGSSGCYTDPVGFVVKTGDQVFCTDLFQTELECHIVLSDVVAMVEA